MLTSLELRFNWLTVLELLLCTVLLKWPKMFVCPDIHFFCAVVPLPGVVFLVFVSFLFYAVVSYPDMLSSQFTSCLQSYALIKCWGYYVVPAEPTSGGLLSQAG